MDEKVVAFNLEEVEGVIIDGRFGLSGQLKFFDSFNKKVNLDRVFSEKLIILNGKTIFIDDTDSDEPFRSLKTGFEKGCLIQLVPRK